jgi:hypothetical protein
MCHQAVLHSTGLCYAMQQGPLSHAPAFVRASPTFTLLLALPGSLPHPITHWLSGTSGTGPASSACWSARHSLGPHPPRMEWCGAPLSLTGVRGVYATCTHFRKLPLHDSPWVSVTHGPYSPPVYSMINTWQSHRWEGISCKQECNCPACAPPQVADIWSELHQVSGKCHREVSAPISTFSKGTELIHWLTSHIVSMHPVAGRPLL